MGLGIMLGAATKAYTEADAEDFGTSESLLEEFGGVFEEDLPQVLVVRE